jgi:hypothetical protein
MTVGNLLAGLILLLQSDPRDRLFEAIRDSKVEETQRALADLLQGDPAKAARAVMAGLPRARERLNLLLLATQRARDNYCRVDTSFGFNINEEVVKQRALEQAVGRIRESARQAMEGERVYQSVFDAFGFLKPEAIPVVAAEAGRTQLWPLKCELLEGLGAMGARQALAEAVARETSPAFLAAALGSTPNDQGTAYLAHSQWQVRLAALDALRRSRAAVGPIVESMSLNDLRFRMQAAATLVRLTETELPAEPGVWSDWWKANREDFVAGAYSARAPRLAEGPGRTVAFYDIPVRSSRVCFLIDRSRSMREQGRFDGAKAELKRLLDAMPDGALVNVIFFSGFQACYAKTPRPLDAHSRRDMITYVEHMTLEPATDLYGGLEKALTMVGNPDSGRLLEEGADTIVVLSDGQATTGRIIDDELIARVVARRARYLRPVFHTVSLSSDSRSLRLLAELTGGEYRAK